MKGQHAEPHRPGRSPGAILEKIARVVSGDYALTVTFAGPPARLEGSAIVLPETMLVDGTLDRLIGTVDLLVARHLFATPRALRALPSRMAHAIAQVVDDHRCGRRLASTHPGAARFLKARREAETQRLRSLNFAAPLAVRYLDALGRRLWDDEIDARADAWLQAALQDADPLIAAARQATSTTDSARHALALLRVLQRHLSDVLHGQQSARDDTGGVNEAAQAQDASREGDDDDSVRDDPNDADPRDDETRPDPLQPDPDLSGFEPDLAPLGDPLEARRPQTPVSGAAIEAAVRAARARRAPALLYSVPLTREFDRVTDHSGRGDRAEWTRLRRRALKATGRLAEKLERALKAEEPSAWRYEQERGHIHPAALGRLAAHTGYRTPFRIERTLPSRNLAISILIDLSASMAGEKLQIAKLCTAAMAVALGRLGYPYEIIGFSSIVDAAMREHYQQALARGVDMRRYNRFVERLDMQVFKSFAIDDPSGIVAMRCGDQNPDGEALAWAAERLQARRGERHVMFVLSDGHPVTGDGVRQVLQSDLQLRIRRLRDQGVELVGIGVGDDAAATYYDNAIVVRDLAALPTIAFDRLSRTLLGSQRHPARRAEGVVT